MIFLIIILLVTLCILLVERLAIARYVSTIDLRIHINGTRGKTSVAEYIAAGLQSTGHGVMLKVTGVKPVLNHDGVSTDIKRRGGARVQEQFSVLRQAYLRGVKNMVLECMSISPELQRLESRVYKPHIYVITNIKDDHREVMGYNLDDQVEAICSAIPPDCTVITNETLFLENIRKAAGLVGSEVIVPESLDNQIIEELPFGVFHENISLALSVCDQAGVDSILVREGVIKSAGIMENPLVFLKRGEKELSFLNGLSVNDVGSTISFIDHWQSKIEYNDKYSIILNTRHDRPLRTDQFTSWIADSKNTIDKIIITGTHAHRAKKRLIGSGFIREKVHIWKLRDISVESLFGIVKPNTMVIGIGNIGGMGQKIIRELK